jgi:hypothetical protein
MFRLKRQQMALPKWSIHQKTENPAKFSSLWTGWPGLRLIGSSPLIQAQHVVPVSGEINILTFGVL